MTIAFIFWLLLIIAIVIGAFYRVWPTTAYVWPIGGLFLLVLLILLGIGVFGWPIRG